MKRHSKNTCRESIIFANKANTEFLKLVTKTFETFNESNLGLNKQFNSSNVSVLIKPCNKLYTATLSTIITSPKFVREHSSMLVMDEQHFNRCHYTFILREPFNVNIFDENSNSIIQVEYNISGNFNINIINENAIGMILSIEDKSSTIDRKTLNIIKDDN